MPAVLALQERFNSTSHAESPPLFYIHFFILRADGHTLGAIQVVITDEAWDSLTPEQQDVLTEAGEYASQYNRQISQETEDKILEELKADGVNVIEVDDITPWQDACKDVIEEATKNNKELYQQIVDMQ